MDVISTVTNGEGLAGGIVVVDSRIEIHRFGRAVGLGVNSKEDSASRGCKNLLRDRDTEGDLNDRFDRRAGLDSRGHRLRERADREKSNSEDEEDR